MGDILKQIFVSSIRDDSTKIFEIAKKSNLEVEVLGFIQPYINGSVIRVYYNS